MRSHRRRSRLEHVLVAGEFDELDTIARILALLPDDAYGQVYVECAPDQVLPELMVPARVQVTALTAHHEPGVRVVAAVDAWLAEWIPQQSCDDRVFTIWAGASVPADAVCADLPLERL